MFPEVYTVAEVGLNYRNFQDAKQSITDAKMAGADAVKFQWFNREDLYGEDGKEESKKSKFQEEWLADLKEKADAVGIHLACSVFNPKKVEKIDRFVNFHKVAASEARWPHLLHAVFKTLKPVMINVGGLHDREIRRIVTMAGKFMGDMKNLVLMYGEPSYPSRYHYMPRVKELVEKYPSCTIGFSDHSIDVIDAPMRAQHYGAQVIEKHFQSVPGEYPDTNHSLGADEFRIMVKALKRETSLEGLGRDQYVRFYNRRLMATRRIEPRDRMRYGVNYAAVRIDPAEYPEGNISGLNPLIFDIVEGQPATRRIQPGEGISGENVAILKVDL